MMVLNPGCIGKAVGESSKNTLNQAPPQTNIITISRNESLADRLFNCASQVSSAQPRLAETPLRGMIVSEIVINILV